ncbi:MAG: aldolase/citrate lyase family protein [Clostridia bacterium]|nr:aldolase/citrate lyase family protein [Clostridia bacterium]
MHMRESRVLRKMRAGEVAVCTKLNLMDTRAAEIAAMSGVDCLWLCMEHVPNDYKAIEDMIRAAKIYDCDVMTRVAKGSYNDLIRPLEADSTGIMVPHLMSYEEAKKIVYYTKFHPIGRRPIDGGNADGKFCLVNENDYMKEANDQRFIVVQIEDPEPLDELEEICALPGIDMLFFGPADFSQGAGIPCQWDNPLLEETRKRVCECARKHGKWAGTTCGAGDFDRLAEMGYTFLSVGADVVFLANGFKATADLCGRKIKEF